MMALFLLYIRILDLLAFQFVCYYQGPPGRAIQRFKLKHGVVLMLVMLVMEIGYENFASKSAN
jgi:hypothetical protein